MEMVELDVEARQGDSGGPILNQRGEIAGVLFGAGQGTTLGSFAPRVSNFLASLAPDIGQAREQAQVAVADRPAPKVEPINDEYRNGTVAKYPNSPWPPAGTAELVSSPKPPPALAASVEHASTPSISEAVTSQNNRGHNRWYEPLKSTLAIVGLAAVALRLVKAML
jgi:hypothetical protein